MKKNLILCCLLLCCIGFMLTGCRERQHTGTYLNLVLVELTASDCSACQQVHHIVQNIKPLYAKKFEFLTLDITDSINRKHAIETARLYNCDDFVTRYQHKPGVVALINRYNGMQLGFLEKDTHEKHYTHMIDGVLHKGHK